MIEVTFKAESLEGVFDAMREALDMPKKVNNEAAEETEKSIPKKVEKKEESATLTLADVKKMAKAKIEEGKSKDIKEVLKKMKVAKVGDLEENQFVEFIEKLEAL
ncbi:TPA: hypothetical protein SUN31_001836 [Streptococcus equi subsp. equi]|nr:hypothetical protein [Streptococcus equi subsp. equi]HEK9255714.1 hypothetical protein [Streptococcus equi subsp. equi]HEK9261552.1 hypothetical protein [Streptococcus equi subsp. equi]HEK9273090.1 hypothetical protein [Streptococcus equi subsp. equi]HEK9276996.1 hypothetical protein [Streptococcus equi subsp. equi]